MWYSSGATAAQAAAGVLLAAAWWLGAETAAAAAQLPPCPELCGCYELEERLYVDCSGQGLTHLPPGISSEVQVLDLSYNLFDSYPEGLQHFWNLEVISFVGNQLSVPLPQYFGNLGRLEILNLSRNKYEEWDNYGLGNPLEKLDLSLNFISRLGATSLRGMSSLQLLNLSENRITKLPENLFDETYNLQTLILSRNNIEYIPRFDTASLEVLDLSACQIASITTDSFAGKSSLLEVDLSKNIIEVIPDYLHSSTLQTLDLSYNDIKTINANTFRAMPHLAVLDLSGNDFDEIWTPEYFSENRYLRDVHLTGIRWGCEGFGMNLLLMYEFLTREPPRVADADTLICYTPSNVTGTSWRRAYVLTWHSDEWTVEGYAYTAVAVGLLVGTVVTALLCRARMRRKLRSRLETEGRQRPAQNLSNGARAASRPEIRAAPEAAVTRVPLRPPEDSPPTYAEALLMPRLDGSFHSLPEYLGEETRSRAAPGSRLSRSTNTLLDAAAEADARRTFTRRTNATPES